MAALTLGNLELALLLAVARLGDDAYGLAIRHDVSARLERDCSVGAIYTTLGRLEEKGLISSHVTPPTPTRGGRSRRLFTVTAAGHRAIRDAERAARSIWAGVHRPITPRHACNTR
jgi:DNA-binding PadR family transcriptional regulator